MRDRQGDTHSDAGVGPDHGTPPGMPLWVKVSGVVVGALILLAIGLMVLGGEHGPGRHGPGGGGDHAGDTPVIEGAPELAVSAGDLAFDPDRIELPVGMPVNVALTSADILHDLVVDESDFHLAADRDETVIGGLVFDEPGSYVGYCSVEGHRDAGMELEIVVTPSDGP
jgi:plastocyanin